MRLGARSEWSFDQHLLCELKPFLACRVPAVQRGRVSLRWRAMPSEHPVAVRWRCGLCRPFWWGAYKPKVWKCRYHTVLIPKLIFKAMLWLIFGLMWYSLRENAVNHVILLLTPCNRSILVINLVLELVLEMWVCATDMKMCGNEPDESIILLL